MRQCELCGNRSMEKVLIPLLYYKSNEAFAYYKCCNCGCLHIGEIPDNIGEYYARSGGGISWKDRVFNKAKEYDMTGTSFLGKICHHFYGYDDYSFLRQISSGMNILDIGCGSNECLEMIKKNYGSKMKLGHLDGIDPYIDNTKITESGIHLYKTDIYSYKQEYKYDFVMLNHVFEHLDEPRSVLLQLKRFLKKDAILSIGIPMMNDYIWEEYGIYAQTILCPPIHFHLYTFEGMKELLMESGYKIIKYTCTMTPTFKLWAEHYKSGKPVTFARTLSALLSVSERKMLEKENKGDIGRFICTLS